jgi:hypothetical protein
VIAAFSILRALVLLRRCTIALESIATSQMALTVIAYDNATKQPRTKPRATEFGVLDIDEVNKRWREQRIVDGVEDES